ncbi:MAG: NAD(+)/NADH kinase [Chloroflexi bacterium]|nr:NAD(+)/NADH kinase [Chloroflexota bacterium]
MSGRWPRRRALLVINSKSGPKRDSLLLIHELVDVLGDFQIHVDVHVKLRKKQAREAIHAAATSGNYDLVIAAGGDGTVEAVARGLLETQVPLGIIPLGTFNNVATSLRIPTDLRKACRLIATGATHPVDVGFARTADHKKERPFLEISAVGLGAIAGKIGQDIQKGRWAPALAEVPTAVEMASVPMRVRLDDGEAMSVRSLLVTVSVSPRSGAGFQLAPRARMDDGLFDIAIFEGSDTRAVLADVASTAFGPLPLSAPANVRHLRAAELDIWTAEPLPVSVGPKLIGQTPARFRMHHGALTVISEPGATAANGSAARAFHTLLSVLGNQVVPHLGFGKRVPLIPVLGGLVFGWISQPIVAQALRRLRR